MLLIGGATGELAAQNVLLDEGSFTLYLNGEEVGTETFSIHRRGRAGEATLLATGLVSMERPNGALRLQPTLRTGVSRRPQAYQNKIEGEDASEVMLSAADDHFVAVIRSAAGEREREMRAREGTVVLDRHVAHHYYFLAPSATQEGTTIPVIVPTIGRQRSVEVISVGTDELRRNAEVFQARHVRLRTDGEVHEVWFDEQGRVLEVEIPSSSYRAVRDSP